MTFWCIECDLSHFNQTHTHENSIQLLRLCFRCVWFINLVLFFALFSNQNVCFFFIFNKQIFYLKPWGGFYFPVWSDAALWMGRMGLEPSKEKTILLNNDLINFFVLSNKNCILWTTTTTQRKKPSQTCGFKTQRHIYICNTPAKMNEGKLLLIVRMKALTISYNFFFLCSPTWDMNLLQRNIRVFFLLLLEICVSLRWLLLPTNFSYENIYTTHIQHERDYILRLPESERSLKRTNK